MNALPYNNASIRLEFNGSDGSEETVFIPNENAWEDLIDLSSDALEAWPCYHGSALGVVHLLDELAEEAGKEVLLYQRSIQGMKVLLKLHVRNARKRVQKTDISIELCH